MEWWPLLSAAEISCDSSRGGASEVLPEIPGDLDRHCLRKVVGTETQLRWTEEKAQGRNMGGITGRLQLMLWRKQEWSRSQRCRCSGGGVFHPDGASKSL